MIRSCKAVTPAWRGSELTYSSCPPWVCPGFRESGANEMSVKPQILALLLMPSTVSAAPEVFYSAVPSEGRVLVVAERGEDLAEALARCSLDCALSHAENASELQADLDWAREKFGYNITAVGLGSRSPLVQKLDNLSVAGRICIDPLSLEPRGPFDLLGEIPSHRGNLKNENIHLLVMVTVPGNRIEDSGSMFWKNVSGSASQDNSAAQRQLRQWIAVQQPLPFIGLQKAICIPSTNWDVRPLPARVDKVVLQATDISAPEPKNADVLDRARCNHYLIAPDGSVTQMVDERFTARCDAGDDAGSTIWIGLTSSGTASASYSEDQYQAIDQLVQNIRTRWGIPSDGVILSKSAEASGFKLSKLKGSSN